MRSADTSPEAYAVQIEMYRRMTPERRLELGFDMSEQGLRTMADGIRSRHPEYGENDVRWALLRLRHGDELFSKVWPGAPLLVP